jgi:hypothetical protein
LHVADTQQAGEQAMADFKANDSYEFFCIDRRGTTRLTVCIGPVAIKFSRHADGQRCNRDEARRWKAARKENRPKLCPVLFAVPCGLALVMRRATPLTADEAHHLRATRGLPEWHYVPDDPDPFEPKASDWGRLSDGRLVALDYPDPPSL